MGKIAVAGKKLCAWSRGTVAALGEIFTSFTKATAVITLSCFLYTSVFSQGLFAMAQKSEETGKASRAFEESVIPYTAGRITDAACFGGDTVVINIQDLHCHAEVQRNIARILKALDDRFDLKKVYLEGSTGRIDTSWIDLIENAKAREDVVETLVNAGKLTGTEYYAIKAGRKDLLNGLEDSRIYDENIQRLAEILRNKGEIEKLLPEIKNRLASLKGMYFSARNQRLDRLVERSKTGDLNSEKYYRELVKLAEKNGIDGSEYPNITRFLDLLEQQRALSYRKITQEMQAYVASLKERLPYAAYAALIDRTRDGEALDALYSYLSRVAAEYHLNIGAQYPHLAKFFEFIDKNGNINPLEQIREERRLVRELHTAQAGTGGEAEVAALSDYFVYFEEYLDNRISAENYEYFAGNRDEFKLLWAKYIGKEYNLSSYCALMDKFYEVNVERNRLFLKNALAIQDIQAQPRRLVPEIDHVAKTIEALQSAKNIVVAVTGGFHTDGVAELLKSKGITYLVVTPSVTKDARYADEVYTKLAEEQAKIASQTIALQAYSQALLKMGDVNAEQKKVLQDVLLQKVKEAFAQNSHLSPEEIAEAIDKELAASELGGSFKVSDPARPAEYRFSYDFNGMHSFTLEVGRVSSEVQASIIDEEVARHPAGRGILKNTLITSDTYSLSRRLGRKLLSGKEPSETLVGIIAFAIAPINEAFAILNLNEFVAQHHPASPREAFQIKFLTVSLYSLGILIGINVLFSLAAGIPINQMLGFAVFAAASILGITVSHYPMNAIIVVANAGKWVLNRLLGTHIPYYRMLITDDEELTDRAALPEITKLDITVDDILVITPDGKNIVTAGKDGVKTWEIENGIVKAGKGTKLKGLDNGVKKLIVTPDSKRLIALGDVLEKNEVYAWKIREGHIAIEGKKLEGFYEKTGVNEIIGTPDGKNLIAATDYGVFVLQLDNPRVTEVWQKLWQYDLTNVRNLVVSPDGKMLIAIGKEGVFRWQISNGEFKWGNRISLGKFPVLVDSVWDHVSTYDEVWSAASVYPEVYEMRENLPGDVSYITVTPDNQNLIMAYWSSLTVIRIEDGHITFLDTNYRPIDVSRIGITPDGRNLVVKEDSDNALVVAWEIENGTIRNTEGTILGERLNHDLAITPDGKNLVAGGANGKLRVWKIENGKIWFATELDGPSAEVLGVFVTSDGRMLISWGEEGEMYVWGIKDGNIDNKGQKLEGISGLVRDFRTINNSNNVIVRTFDNELYILKRKDGYEDIAVKDENVHSPGEAAKIGSDSTLDRQSSPVNDNNTGLAADKDSARYGGAEKVEELYGNLPDERSTTAKVSGEDEDVVRHEEPQEQMTRSEKLINIIKESEYPREIQEAVALLTRVKTRDAKALSSFIGAFDDIAFIEKFIQATTGLGNLEPLGIYLSAEKIKIIMKNHGGSHRHFGGLMYRLADLMPGSVFHNDILRYAQYAADEDWEQKGTGKGTDVKEETDEFELYAAQLGNRGEDSATRMNALKGLLKYGERAWDPLIYALSDDSAWIRSEAINALVNNYDRKATIERVLGKLWGTVEDQDNFVYYLRVEPIEELFKKLAASAGQFEQAYSNMLSSTMLYYPYTANGPSNEFKKLQRKHEAAERQAEREESQRQNGNTRIFSIAILPLLGIGALGSMAGVTPMGAGTGAAILGFITAFVTAHLWLSVAVVVAGISGLLIAAEKVPGLVKNDAALGQYYRVMNYGIRTNAAKGIAVARKRVIKQLPGLITDEDKLISIFTWLKDENRVKKASQQTIDEALARIERGLRSPGGLDSGKITEIMNDLKAEIAGVRDGSLALDKTDILGHLEGEVLDIVDANDRVTAKTDRGLAHRVKYNLRNRASNVFVMTPDGKLLMHRRVHNKIGMKKLSLFGGHVMSGESYRDALQRELKEELYFAEPGKDYRLQGRLVQIGTDGQFVQDSPDNNELRSLYVYVMAPAEYERMLARKASIEKVKKEKTEKEFEAWIEEQQKMNSGDGEVWGYHIVDMDAIVGKSSLDIEEEFSTGKTVTAVEFTNDLLEPLVKGTVTIRPDTPAVDVMNEVKIMKDNIRRLSYLKAYDDSGITKIKSNAVINKLLRLALNNAIVGYIWLRLDPVSIYKIKLKTGFYSKNDIYGIGKSKNKELINPLLNAEAGQNYAEIDSALNELGVSANDQKDYYFSLLKKGTSSGKYYASKKLYGLSEYVRYSDELKIEIVGKQIEFLQSKLSNTPKTKTEIVYLGTTHLEHVPYTYTVVSSEHGYEVEDVLNEWVQDYEYRTVPNPSFVQLSEELNALQKELNELNNKSSSNISSLKLVSLFMPAFAAFTAIIGTVAFLSKPAAAAFTSAGTVVAAGAQPLAMAGFNPLLGGAVLVLVVVAVIAKYLSGKRVQRVQKDQRTAFIEAAGERIEQQKQAMMAAGSLINTITESNDKEQIRAAVNALLEISINDQESVRYFMDSFGDPEFLLHFVAAAAGERGNFPKRVYLSAEKITVIMKRLGASPRDYIVLMNSLADIIPDSEYHDLLLQYAQKEGIDNIDNWYQGGTGKLSFVIDELVDAAINGSYKEQLEAYGELMKILYGNPTTPAQRVKIMQGLGKDPMFIAVMINFIKDDPERSVRETALSQLAKHTDYDIVVEAMIVMLENDMISDSVAGALKGLDREVVKPLLEDFIRDSNATALRVTELLIKSDRSLMAQIQTLDEGEKKVLLQRYADTLNITAAHNRAKKLLAEINGRTSRFPVASVITAFAAIGAVVALLPKPAAAAGATGLAAGITQMVSVLSVIAAVPIVLGIIVALWLAYSDRKNLSESYSWLMSKSNIVTAREPEIASVLKTIERNLKKPFGIGIDASVIMRNLRKDIKAIRAGSSGTYIPKLKGEALDIVNDKDVVIASIDRGWAHLFGYRHRTANAFVMTPDGKLLLQRRVHNKAEPMKLSIFGGHLGAKAGYEESIKRELIEELNLNKLGRNGKRYHLKGKLVRIGLEGQFVNHDPRNNELRSLYVYVLTSGEYAEVLRKAKEIEEVKAAKTQGDFEAWIEEQQGARSGYGEVWGYHELEVDDIAGKTTVDIEETFSTGKVVTPVSFTSDLLAPIVNGTAAVRPGTSAIDVMTEVNTVKTHRNDLSKLKRYTSQSKLVGFLSIMAVLALIVQPAAAAGATGMAAGIAQMVSVMAVIAAMPILAGFVILGVMHLKPSKKIVGTDPWEKARASLKRMAGTVEELKGVDVDFVVNELMAAKDFKLKGEDVDVVSKDSDRVAGSIDRNIAEKLGLFHRTSNIILVDSKDNIILQQRAAHKSTFPNYWTIYGGHVDAGMNYEAGAVKELLEESGIYDGKTITAELKKSLKERLIPVGVPGNYVYDVPGETNRERRALYVFKLTPEEEESFEARNTKLMALRAKHTDNDGKLNENTFNLALQVADEEEKGKWEVSDVKRISFNDMLDWRSKPGTSRFTPDLFDYMFDKADVKDEVKGVLILGTKYPYHEIKKLYEEFNGRPQRFTMKRAAQRIDKIVSEHRPHLAVNYDSFSEKIFLYDGSEGKDWLAVIDYHYGAGNVSVRMADSRDIASYANYLQSPRGQHKGLVDKLLVKAKKQYDGGESQGSAIENWNTDAVKDKKQYSRALLGAYLKYAEKTGTKVPFRGNSLVSSIRMDSGLGRALADTLAPDSALGKMIATVAPESIHMTLYDLVADEELKVFTYTLVKDDSFPWTDMLAGSDEQRIADDVMQYWENNNAWFKELAANAAYREKMKTELIGKIAGLKKQGNITKLAGTTDKGKRWTDQQVREALENVVYASANKENKLTDSAFIWQELGFDWNSVLQESPENGAAAVIDYWRHASADKFRQLKPDIQEQVREELVRVIRDIKQNGTEDIEVRLQQAAFNVVQQHALRAIENLHFDRAPVFVAAGTAAFPPKYIGQGKTVFILRMLPKTGEDLAKVIKLQDAIRKETGINNFGAFVGHVTLGYNSKGADEEALKDELIRIGDQFAQKDHEFKKDYEFELGTIEPSYFEDMDSFPLAPEEIGNKNSPQIKPYSWTEGKEKVKTNKNMLMSIGVLPILSLAWMGALVGKAKAATSLMGTTLSNSYINTIIPNFLGEVGDHLWAVLIGTPIILLLLGKTLEIVYRTVAPFSYYMRKMQHEIAERQSSANMVKIEDIARHLGEIRNPKAIELLISALRKLKYVSSSDPLGAYFESINEALIKLHVAPDKRYDIYIEMLDYYNHELKIQVIRELVKLGDKRAIRSIIAQYPTVGLKEVDEALKDIGASKEEVDDFHETYYKHYVNWVNTVDRFGSQINAVENLGRLGDRRAIAPIIAMIANHRFSNYEKDEQIIEEVMIKLGATQEEMIELGNAFLTNIENERANIPEQIEVSVKIGSHWDITSVGNYDFEDVLVDDYEMQKVPNPDYDKEYQKWTDRLTKVAKKLDALRNNNEGSPMYDAKGAPLNAVTDGPISNLENNKSESTKLLNIAIIALAGIGVTMGKAEAAMMGANTGTTFLDNTVISVTGFASEHLWLTAIIAILGGIIGQIVVAKAKDGVRRVKDPLGYYRRKLEIGSKSEVLNAIAKLDAMGHKKVVDNAIGSILERYRDEEIELSENAEILIKEMSGMDHYIDHYDDYGNESMPSTPNQDYEKKKHELDWVQKSIIELRQAIETLEKREAAKSGMEKSKLFNITIIALLGVGFITLLHFNPIWTLFSLTMFGIVVETRPKSGIKNWDELLKKLQEQQRAIELTGTDAKIHARKIPAGNDLFASVRELFATQDRLNIGAASKIDETTKEPMPESFIKIKEYGKTVDIGVVKGPGVAEVYHGAVDDNVLKDENVSFVAIQNTGRAKRPGRPGGEVSPLTVGNNKDITAENILKKYPLELFLEWRSPSSGSAWWMTANPFPIWPYHYGKSEFDQVYHVTFSRSDKEVQQKEMRNKDNILDVLNALAAVNSSADIQGRTKFRAGINGWFPTDKLGAPKSGASQNQAHAQLLAFAFPIERAKTRLIGNADGVSISVLDEGDEAWGQGIVLEAAEKDSEKLARKIHDTLELITDREHSFNVFVAPTGNGYRAYISDKVRGTPSPYFNNEWAFAEFARAIVIDAPEYFYSFSREQQQRYEEIVDEMEKTGKKELLSDWIAEEKKAGRLEQIRPDLYDKVKAATNEISASREEVAEIANTLLLQSLLTTGDVSREDLQADVLILAGNDDLATFEEALELYRAGRVKKVIIAGGIGRMTPTLVRKMLQSGMPVVIEGFEGMQAYAVLEALALLEQKEKKKKGSLAQGLATTEARIIRDVITYIAKRKGYKEDLRMKKDFHLEELSTNTPMNIILSLPILQNIREDMQRSGELKAGDKLKVAVMTTPYQQFRTKATAERVFSREHTRDLYTGVSYTTDVLNERNVTETVVSEMWKLIIYTAKGDLLPGKQGLPDVPEEYWRAALAIAKTQGMPLAADVYANRKEALLKDLKGQVTPAVGEFIDWVYATASKPASRAGQDPGWSVVQKLPVLEDMKKGLFAYSNVPTALQSHFDHTQMTIDGMQALLNGDYDYLFSRTAEGRSGQRTVPAEFKATMQRVRALVLETTGNDKDYKLALELLPQVADIGKSMWSDPGHFLPDHWNRSADWLNDRVFRELEARGYILSDRMKNTLTVAVRNHYYTGEIIMAVDRSVLSPLDYNKTLKYQAEFLKNIDKAGADYRVIMALDIASLVGDVSALSSVSYNALVDQFEALADYADDRQLFEQEIAEMPKTKGYRTVIQTTKWLKANMGNPALPADELEKRLQVLREHFTAMHAAPAKINELLDGIRNEVGKADKDRQYTGLKLNNELVSILTAGNDGVLRETGWTNARFAHALGFRHGTANAFVLTPDGKLLLQRRIPHRAQELKFSILGGHLSRGESFEKGIRKELLEELSLLDRQSELRGQLKLIGEEGQFVNEDPQNREFRSLYIYTMTPDEYAYFKKKVVDTLNNERRKGDREDFERWLIEQNKMKKGYGEVWNYLEIEPSALQAMIAAGKNALDYTEEYRTGPEDQVGVEFTGDLLLPLLQGEALQRPGIAPVNPLDELEAVLRAHHPGAASPVVVTPFLTPFIGTKGLLSGRVIWEQVLNMVAPSDRRPVARKLFPALTGVNYVMDSPDMERAKELAATGLKVSVIMPLPVNADVGGMDNISARISSKANLGKEFASVYGEKADGVNIFYYKPEDGSRQDLNYAGAVLKLIADNPGKFSQYGVEADGEAVAAVFETGDLNVLDGALKDSGVLDGAVTVLNRVRKGGAVDPLAEERFDVVLQDDADAFDQLKTIESYRKKKKDEVRYAKGDPVYSVTYDITRHAKGLPGLTIHALRQIWAFGADTVVVRGLPSKMTVEARRELARVIKAVHEKENKRLVTDYVLEGKVQELDWKKIEEQVIERIRMGSDGVRLDAATVAGDTGVLSADIQRLQALVKRVYPDALVAAITPEGTELSEPAIKAGVKRAIRFEPGKKPAVILPGTWAEMALEDPLLKQNYRYEATPEQFAADYESLMKDDNVEIAGYDFLLLDSGINKLSAGKMGELMKLVADRIARRNNTPAYRYAQGHRAAMRLDVKDLPAEVDELYRGLGAAQTEPAKFLEELGKVYGRVLPAEPESVVDLLLEASRRNPDKEELWRNEALGYVEGLLMRAALKEHMSDTEPLIYEGDREMFGWVLVQAHLSKIALQNMKGRSFNDRREYYGKILEPMLMRPGMPEELKTLLNEITAIDLKIDNSASIADVSQQVKEVANALYVMARETRDPLVITELLKVIDLYADKDVKTLNRIRRGVLEALPAATRAIQAAA